MLKDTLEFANRLPSENYWQWSRRNTEGKWSDKRFMFCAFFFQTPKAIFTLVCDSIYLSQFGHFFFIFVSSRAKIIYEKDNTQGLCQSASQRTISQIFAYCKNKIHRSGKNQVRQLNSFCMHGIPSFKEYLSPIL